MKKPTDSPVISLLRNVWTNCGRHSWQALNECMAEALRIAIRGGYKFAEDDFSRIVSDPREDGFDGHRWMGDSERYYSMACGANRGTSNTSAAIAFERYQSRTPFLIAQPRVKSRARLAVGMAITYHGERWIISSFSSGSSYVNAIQHAPMSRAVSRRIRITHEDVREHNKAMRSPKPAQTES